jgi:hypothetical protein
MEEVGYRAEFDCLILLYLNYVPCNVAPDLVNIASDFMHSFSPSLVRHSCQGIHSTILDSILVLAMDDITCSNTFFLYRIEYVLWLLWIL